MPRGPPPAHGFRAEFDLPGDLEFAGCTDYRPDDALRAGERYERRLLDRTPRGMAFEDLAWTRGGGRWRRTSVETFPPNRWHAESIGHVRQASLDDRLGSLPGGRTRPDRGMRHRPTALYPDQPPRAQAERELAHLGRNLARAMARDHRATRRPPRPGRGARRP
ncbi:MAG TPA: hypothetical protein VMG99_03340 [Thermoplasmata archaeon]|nr:hypothetical protein [Thermoplasmata archaeon]